MTWQTDHRSAGFLTSETDLKTTPLQINLFQQSTLANRPNVYHDTKINSMNPL